jgi:Right handed beta helix region
VVPVRLAPRRRTVSALICASLAIVVAVSALALAAPAAASGGCDLIASPTGSDASGDGSAARPFQTLQELDRMLSPGQTGCLHAGVYGSIATLHRIDTGGSAAGRISITSYPGERATVVGWVDIEASYVTVSYLNIDGSNTFYRQHPSGEAQGCRVPASQSLVIAGHDDIFEHNNYYQSNPRLRGNGIGVGYWGDASNTVIRFNRIHDVGGCDFFDHLIYLASGNKIQVYGNWMWNDPHGWGIHFYPGPTNAQVWANVIDGAGSGVVFGDEPGGTTSGNKFFSNVVTDSVGVSNPDIHWSHEGVMATAPGFSSTDSRGNWIIGNDSFGNPGGVLNSAMSVGSDQVTATRNIAVDPEFVNPTVHDYKLRPDSPVVGFGLWNGN